MSYSKDINQKTKAYLKQLRNVNKDTLIKRAIPVITSGSFLLHSTEFLAPSIFSKYLIPNHLQ